MSVSTLTAVLLASASPAPATVPAADPVPAAGPVELAIAQVDAGAMVVAASEPVAAPVAAPVSGPVSGPAPPQPAPDAAAPPPGTDPAAPAPATPGAPGDIVVTGYNRASPTDPLSDVNVAVYNIATDVDVALVEPVAMGYAEAVPGPVRRGISNALFNLREPIYAANFLLQHKIGKTVETLARFVLNSTLGLLGLFDVAKKKPFHLPRRVNGLGNTLGFYGVPPGPYLYVPLVGPTTLRDLFGVTVDTFAVPVLYGPPINSPYFATPATVVYQLEERVRGNARIQRIRESTGDPYLTQRREYLRRRQEEINMLRCGRADCGDVIAPTIAPAPAVGPAPVAPTAVPEAPAPAYPDAATPTVAVPPVAEPR